MKYLAMLKKEENTHQEALPKLPEPPFDSYDSDPRRHISEKQAPPAPDWYDVMICRAIDDLSAAGVEVLNYPESVRDRARVLFDEFSEAAAADDMAGFWRALRQWRETWKGSLH